MVTGSGLIFIAGTRDERIRAFDKKTGNVLWEYQLPASGFSSTITYEADNKQYMPWLPVEEEVRSRGVGYGVWVEVGTTPLPPPAGDSASIRNEC